MELGLPRRQVKPASAGTAASETKSSLTSLYREGCSALDSTDAWKGSMVKKVLKGLLAFAWLGSQLMAGQSLNYIQFADPGTVQLKPAQDTHTFTGQWRGALDVGATRLPATVLVFKQKEGTFAASIMGLYEGFANADSVELMGDKVRLEFMSIGGSFQGKMNAAGSEITGEWKQGRASLPLVLQRAGNGSGIIGGIIGRVTPKGPPASLGGFEDAASFSFLVDEKALGAMQSSWTSDGNFESRAEVTRAGQTVQIITKITADAEGRWTKIVSETPLTTITMICEGNKIARTIGKNTRTLPANKDVLLYDDNSPALISQALRAYDRSRGGAQRFPVLSITKDEEELTLEARETTEYTVRGQSLSLTRFQYSVPGTDLNVLADSTGKVYSVEWPARKAAFVRKGYEGLRHVEARAKN
jgi:hypothetical protein